MRLHFNNHLTIGFAGKRLHPKLSLIAQGLPTLLSAIYERSPDLNVRFISGLADGADQMTAEIFLKFAKGVSGSVKYKMGAIIPFSKDQYLETIENKILFDELFQQCDQQLELDGKYMPGENSESLNSRNIGYQQQGSIIACSSDILLAVVPYNESERIGGTIETIITTLSMKKPVILLNLNDGELYLYRTLEEWFQQTEPLIPREIVAKLITDPEELTVFPDYPTTNSKIYQLRKKAWQLFELIFKGAKENVEWDKVEPQNELHHQLELAQMELDEKAIYFQNQYRGGYILNYLLALLAIFLAVGSAVFLLLEKHIQNSEIVHNTLWIVGLIKLAFLIIIYKNTKNINSEGYNKKAIDYRYASERLRANTFLSMIGIVRSPKPSLGNHSKKFFTKYTGEAIYQMQMTIKLNQKFHHVVTKENLKNYLMFIKNNWILDQKKYHERESKRTHKMEKRLEKIPEILSKSIIFVVVFDLLLGAFLIAAHGTHNLFTNTISIAIPILLGLTAFIPAMITTLNSINVQSDAHRLVLRAELMIQELGDQFDKIQDAISVIEKKDSGSNFYKVMKLADETANLLTDEVAEWSLIYEKQLAEL